MWTVGLTVEINLSGVLWTGARDSRLLSTPFGAFLLFRKIYCMEKSRIQLLCKSSFTKCVDADQLDLNNGTLSVEGFVRHIVLKSESYLLTERAEPVSMWHSKQRGTKASCVISSVTFVTEKNLQENCDVKSYTVDSA